MFFKSFQAQPKGLIIRRGVLSFLISRFLLCPLLKENPRLCYTLNSSSFSLDHQLKLQMQGLSVADADFGGLFTPIEVQEGFPCDPPFNETFDGVLLAYDVNIPDKEAKMISGVHPYFGLRLKANLLLFSPKSDMVLEGKVVKLSQESIHVIILGFLSAIITAENIRGEFKYKTVKRRRGTICQQISQVAFHKGWNQIRFLVKSFDEQILHIIGSLMPVHTGNIHWLDRNLEEISEFDRSATKSRDREWQDDKTVDEGATPLSYNNHIKK
ncbi:hypothetical protein CRYUN_Cryun35bG0013300 [Craigia yunnanensis]